MKERDRQAERRYGDKNGALASPRLGLWDDIFYLTDLMPAALSGQSLTMEALFWYIYRTIEKDTRKTCLAGLQP